MSERYTKDYECPQNVYAESSPVVISAGALLKDNQTGKILEQLKIRNITNKVIKATRVSILSFDTLGNLIDSEINYEYLDLCVGRDCEFGQKVPIILPNDSTRAISVKVDEIIFDDNSVWNYGGQEWEPLVSATNLTSISDDLETVKQFKIEYGENCEYETIEEKDIWICSCGKINKKEEATCFSCNNSLEILKNIDVAKLVDNKNVRIENEKQEKEHSKKKKYKTIGFIVVLLICITMIPTLLINNAKNAEVYNAAEQKFEEGKYFEAFELYTQSLGYKDSKEKTNQAMLYYLALEINIYDYTYNTGDLRELYGATDVSPTEMKKILTSSSWVTRIYDGPSYRAIFNKDYTVSCEYLGYLGQVMDYSYWGTSGDFLMFSSAIKTDSIYFKFLKLADGLYIAYTDEGNGEIIRQIFIEENSEWYDRYMERYSAEIKEWKEKTKK